MSANFEAYHDGKLIFSSDGHWLHPLFLFEDFLNEWTGDRATLSVRDKIVGRAAALLMVQLGLKQIHAVTISRLAIETLEYHHIQYSYDYLIDRVACRTEDLLRQQLSAQDAYDQIAQLRRNSLKPLIS